MHSLPYNVYFCPLLLGFWYYTMRQTNLNDVFLSRYLCHVLMFGATFIAQNNKKQDFLPLLCVQMCQLSYQCHKHLSQVRLLISLWCVCMCVCREGRGSRPAGQRLAGRQRALRRPGGYGEAGRVQSADRGAVALLQLRQHAEACPGQ